MTNIGVYVGEESVIKVGLCFEVEYMTMGRAVLDSISNSTGNKKKFLENFIEQNV